MVGTHGQESQNGRRLSWAKAVYVVPVERSVTPSDVHRRVSAVCGHKAPAPALCSTGCGTSVVARQPHMSGTVTPLNTGSMKPPGSSQGDGTVVQHRRRIL